MVVGVPTRRATPCAAGPQVVAVDVVGFAGVTPVGMKLFEVKSTQGDLKYSFSFPQLKKNMNQKKIAEAVADDIRHIYFGRIPAPGVEVVYLKDRIRYRQPFGKGRLEFIFGGPETRLIEKSYKEGWRKIWKVRYFDYRVVNATIYPSQIYFENKKRKYKVTLRLKEIIA